jgi:hypothetical protein
MLKALSLHKGMPCHIKIKLLYLKSVRYEIKALHYYSDVAKQNRACFRERIKSLMVLQSPWLDPGCCLPVLVEVQLTSR